MINWFGNLKRHWQHTQLKRAVAGLSLAAFGKHPAWDDHMDDIGLDAEILITAKRLLYIRGIRENLDTGAWATMEQDGTVVPFGHRFVWCHQQQTLAGRLWSSKDGRGRHSYPMVVCAYIQATLPAWLNLQLGPTLDALESPCMDLSEADDVRRYLAEQQDYLRSFALAACSPSRPPETDTALIHLSRSLDTPSLLRILYHISREAGVPLESTAARPERAIMARIPVTVAQTPIYPYRWLTFLQSWFSGDTIVSLFQPDRQPWADIFIGELPAAHVFALRAPCTTVPLASAIPYTIPPEFEAVYRRMTRI